MPRTCARCLYVYSEPPPLPHPLPSLSCCPYCSTFTVVREMGEMTKGEDKADPESWGGVGWL